MLRSNPSAEAGTKTEEGGFCCPLFILFGIGIKAINLRGLGTESPGIPNYPHEIAKNHNIVKSEGKKKIETYLTFLVSDRNVAPSTQNQALNALVFFYKHVLKQPLNEKNNAERPAKKVKIPLS